jgi:hypothetical protein
MFYKLQNMVSRYATRPYWREQIVRTLQGNPYIPETQERARKLLDHMQMTYDNVMKDPGNLLRPWSMDPEMNHTLTCPTCLGVADYVAEEQAFVCRRCGAKAPYKRSDSLSASRT